ncbi:MAG: glycosyltransferase family A protein [Kibdelosporangium sp.]
MSQKTSQKQPPSLSVVMPVFNEQEWISRSVGAVVEAATRAAWPVEVIVVDDGSTDGTPAELARLASEHGITVISQRNKGRFEARRAGLAKASGERVMMLDSRVVVDPDSLEYLRDQLVEHPERKVWNGDVKVAAEGNPYAGFMAGLVKIPWRRYFANPRLVSFGIEEFDVYPKGTGYFCAPRELLEQAGESFVSLYEDVSLASDDTRMLRWIAERERIHISPGMSCTYHGRDSLQKFVKHAYFRGTTFVDGYLQTKGPARTGMFGAIAFSILGLVMLAKAPKRAIALGVLTSTAAAVGIKRCGGTTTEARAVGMLLPVFGVACFAGMIRGLVLALRGRNR